jgi:hypothetical protein
MARIADSYPQPPAWVWILGKAEDDEEKAEDDERRGFSERLAGLCYADTHNPSSCSALSRASTFKPYAIALPTRGRCHEVTEGGDLAPKPMRQRQE